MNGFQSYQSYQAPAETPSPSPWSAVRVHDAVNRISSVDGALTETSDAANGKGHSGELNPFHGTDSVFATARNSNGLPVTEITSETLVTIGGVQASVKFFAAEGILQANKDGTFSEAIGKAQEAPQVDTSADFLPLDPAAMGVVNQALAEVDQGSLDSLMATGTGVAIGKLDAASLARRFSQASGLPTEDSHARVATIVGAYQAQANTALQGMGIAPGDLPEFFAWAKANKQGQLQEAVHLQLRTHAIAGYRDLAAQWQAATAPSIAAFKAAGVPVRKQGTGTEVFLKGQWLSPGAASRAGLA